MSLKEDHIGILIRNYLGRLFPERKSTILLFVFSVLIARAKYSSKVRVDKRERGSRLDPDKRYLASEFRHILYYEDVHLPNRNETLLYTYETWQVLREAFTNLFHNETIELLARYHFQTAASILTANRTMYV